MGSYCKMSLNTIPCSNHGSFDPIEKCICFTGWSSLGDFAIIRGVDCDQYIPAIRALAIIDVFIQPFGIFYASRIFYLRYIKGTNWNDPLLLLPLYSIFIFIFNLAMGLAKAIDCTHFIAGRSLVMTFCTSSMAYFFSCLCIVFPLMIGKFFCGYSRLIPIDSQKRVEEKRHLFERWSSFLYGFNFLGCYSLLLTLKYPEYVTIIAGVFYLTLVASYIFLRNNFIGLLEIMIHELNGNLEPNYAGTTFTSTNDQLAVVLARLELIESIIKRQTISVIISNAIFGCWPYLQRKTAYLAMIKGILAFIHTMASLRLIAPSNTLKPLTDFIEATCHISQKRKTKVVPEPLPSNMISAEFLADIVTPYEQDTTTH